MKIVPSRLEGCFEFFADVHRDARGSFVKTFRASALKAAGIETSFDEDFLSTSRKGVLRGLHFQAPPHDQFKIVHCVAGRVFDVVVDIRRTSPTYGAFSTFELGPGGCTGLLLVPGFAHGFYVLSDEAVVAYKVSSEYAPSLDTGIRWDSLAIPWPDANPTVSPRDAALPEWSQFQTPFTQ